MVEKRDYYDVLGISKNASDDEIKSAYRKLVKQMHPDVCTGDKHEAEEAFKVISEAYEVLMNNEKREIYDRYGHAGVDRTWGGDGFTWRNFSHTDDLEDLFGRDIFSEFFGFSPFSYSHTGQSLRISISITLDDAFKGVDKEIEIPRMVPCEECDGTGAKDGAVEECPTCDGSGQVRSARSAGFAQFVTITTCSKCRGAGKRIIEKCDKCDGRGRIEKIERIQITIPRGADNGLRMRIPERGESGMNGGSRGDLYIFVQVEPHSLYRRDDDDLYFELPISFTQAIFGDDIDVPTLDGKCSLKIPEYCQTGTILKIQGKGMPSLSGKKKGDFFIKVNVRTPTSLTARQKELLHEYATISGEKTKKIGLFRKLTTKT